MLRYIKARSSKALARASFRIIGLNPKFLELRVQFSLQPLGKAPVRTGPDKKWGYFGKRECH